VASISCILLFLVAFVSVHELLHVFTDAGNKTTLDIEPKANNICTRDELLKFHGKFYSSNVMALAILGREPLDQLSEMATRMFSDIENKNVTVPVYKETPLTADQLKVGKPLACLSFWVFEYLEILHGYFFPHDNTCGPLVFGDRPNYFFKWPKKIKSIPVIMSETLDQWILLRRVLIQLWDEWSEFFNEKRLHGHKSHGKHVFLFEPKCHVGEVITRSMLSYRLELQYFWFRSHQF